MDPYHNIQEDPDVHCTSCRIPCRIPPPSSWDEEADAGLAFPVEALLACLLDLAIRTRRICQGVGPFVQVAKLDDHLESEQPCTESAAGGQVAAAAAAQPVAVDEDSSAVVH